MNKYQQWKNTGGKAGHGGRPERSWVQGHYFNISKQNTEKASIKTGAQRTSPGITDQDKVPTKQKPFMTNTAKDTERRTLPPRQGWFGLLQNQVSLCWAHGWAPSYPQELKTHTQKTAADTASGQTVVRPGSGVLLNETHRANSNAYGHTREDSLKGWRRKTQGGSEQAEGSERRGCTGCIACG